MKRVFLDAWLDRKPMFTDAQKLLLAAEKKKIVIYTSPSILITTLFFLKKAGYSQETMIGLLDKNLRVVSLVSTTEKVFRQGFYAGFTDLEDAVQYYTALQIPNLDYFITNNSKDFKKATGLLPVITPKDFFNW